MAYAFVQQKEFSENRPSGSSASVATGAFGSALTAGNMMIAIVVYTCTTTNTARTVTLSGAGSPTWNAEASFSDGAGNMFHAFYAFNIPGGTTAQLSAAFSGTDGGLVEYPAIFAAEYSGFKSSGDPRLAFHSNSQATPGVGTDGVTSGLLGTLSTQPAGIVAFSFNYASVAAPTAGTSFTSRTAVWTYQGLTPVCARAEDRRVTATTSVAGTFTAGDDSLHQTVAWAFEEAAAGGGGTINSKTLTDNVTVSDARLQSSFRNRLLSDAITLTDLLIKQIISSNIQNKTLSDTVVVSDSQPRQIFRNRQVGDAIIVSDPSVDLQYIYNINNGDNIDVTDAQFLNFKRYRMVGDSVTLIDIISATTSSSRIVNVTQTDSIVIVDSTFKSALRMRQLADAISTNDALLRALALTRQNLDVLIVIDGAIKVRRYSAQINDFITLSDQLSSFITQAVIYNVQISIGVDSDPFIGVDPDPIIGVDD